ncbi:DUF4870 domain-containing protein [Saliphagus sp. GCM10025308]|uniref:DUF4870 domain-containing protein n=1 Tax=Natronosalvus caseinilyticus TaxID=2953747 RepID=UPI0028ABAFAC|nr:hypothetical protein [Natronosalvus caseinilyticus]
MSNDTPAPDVTDVAETTIADERTQETSLGPDENVLGALSYFTLVGGLLVYLLEDENEFARFHAAQCIALCVGAIALYAGLTIVGVTVSVVLGDVFLIGWLVGAGLSIVSLFVWFALFLVWLYLVVTAFQGKRTRIPVVGNLAESTLL